MKIGKINWLNPFKSFGFITPDDGTEDVYVHWAETDTDTDLSVFEPGLPVKYNLFEETVFPFAAYVDAF